MITMTKSISIACCANINVAVLKVSLVLLVVAAVAVVVVNSVDIETVMFASVVKVLGGIVLAIMVSPEIVSPEIVVAVIVVTESVVGPVMVERTYAMLPRSVIGIALPTPVPVNCRGTDIIAVFGFADSSAA